MSHSILGSPFRQGSYKSGTEHRQVGTEASQTFSEEAKLCGFLLVKGKITFQITFHGTVLGMVTGVFQ